MLAAVASHRILMHARVTVLCSGTGLYTMTNDNVALSVRFLECLSPLTQPATCFTMCNACCYTTAESVCGLRTCLFVDANPLLVSASGSDISDLLAHSWWPRRI